MGRSRKDPYSPTEEISAVRRDGEKKLFLIIVNVLGNPTGVGCKLPISSVGVVWMFSGMTQFNYN
jgi:hypothetical protein